MKVFDGSVIKVFAISTTVLLL